ncbi:LamG domain-containing protein [Actinokineospora globicatena]|uniref:LamG-like jellyroll fold domain-containing protein n=1 Tax=Actinokineospora globicatena TaxID=103729 RepID=A0A9W6V5L3_9PSEU|nr:LamG domain-containing protein [Actinokineospora globicatena]GLW89522.1 hypothetical protein Aglo03_03380 [Actinokineospora globicatena]
MRVAAVALVLAGIGTGVAHVTNQDTAAPPSPVVITEAQDEATAMRAALAQGSRVEVLGERTERRTVHANPDGKLSAEIAVVAKRIRKGAAWVAPDTTLTPADGAITPVATEADLRFSAGGDAPVVRLGTGEASVELTWPTPLPKPTLSGPSATYAEVMPGVDLVMTATTQGYQQHLVVRDREAAANSRVRAIEFGVRATGVTLVDKDIAGLEAVDAKGEVVLSAPTALMWDSAPRPQTENPFSGKGFVDVRLAGDTLTLVPDAALLDSPDTVYPVTIDPNMITQGKQGWTTVYDDGTASMQAGTHWNGANSDPELKPWVPAPSARVGRAYGGGTLTTRSYFQFDTSFLAADRVASKAILNGAIAYGPTCNISHQHQAWTTYGDIGPGTNWANQPGGYVNGVANAGTEYSGCLGHKPIGFDVWNLDYTGFSTYSIRAASETDQNYWRKYDPSAASLYIEFNTRPYQPNNLFTNPSVVACAVCAGRPYIGDTSVNVNGAIADADGQNVKAVWRIYTNSAMSEYETGLQGSGTIATTTIDLTTKDGAQVDWEIAARDDSGAPNNTSSFLGGLSFWVDRTVPTGKPAVSSAVYPADNAWHGGTDVAGAFTFSHPTADIAGYYYGWNGAATTWVDAASLGGSATVTLTPPNDGPQDLYVQAADRARNRSPEQVHHFYVRPGNGPLTQYGLESDIRDSAYLGARHGVAAGTPGFGMAAVGSGMTTDGTGNQYATAPIGVSSAAAYTVSAWVRLDNAGEQNQVAVSQNGVNTAAWRLMYRPTPDPSPGGNWVFSRAGADTAGALESAVVSSAPAQAKVWTHLVGQYDPVAGKTRLYVDGALAGEGPVTGIWPATGSVDIGRGRWSGAWGGFWSGGIDEVKLYDRVVTDADLRATVIRDNVKVAHYRFDDLVAGAVNNEVSGGQPLTPQGDPALVNGQDGRGKAMDFDGVDDGATTAGPVLNSDGNYSVAAWVKLDRVPNAGEAMTFVSQRGPDGNSAFLLSARQGQWTFATSPQTNVYSGWGTFVGSGANTVTAGWTHVAATHNKTTGKAELFVNGVKTSEAAITSSWNASGPLAVGKAWWFGYWTDFTPGLVDEVRAYSRVLAPEEIRSIVSVEGAPAGRWRLDGSGEDSSGPDGSNPRPVTTQGNPSYTAGQSSVPSAGDLALRTGTGAYAATAANVVATDQSFSVAAWAKLDVVGGFPAVVTQDGAHISAFQLQATSTGRWAMTMFSEDTPTGGVPSRLQGAIVQPGVWTHLVGVYDAAAGQLQLYVNGALSGTLPYTVKRASAGPLAIGRAKYNDSTAVDYFPGAIDDVVAHNRALFAEEIQAMAGRDTTLVHHLTFDEGSGATAGDSAGARPATLGAGVTRVPGRVGNAAAFSGTATGVASTAATDLRTDAAFSVAAWVYLPNNTAPCDVYEVGICRSTAVSLDGPGRSKFRLGSTYDLDHPEGVWTFDLPEISGENEVTKAAVNVEPSDYGNWVHLVGTYNPQHGKLWLFVNGSRKGDGTLVTPWHATGGLVVGRALSTAGVAADHWPGKVDDVRLYTGTLDQDRVYTLYKAFPEANDGGPVGTPATPRNRWKLDETTGTTAADSGPLAQNAAISGTTTWVGGRDGRALGMNGSGYAQTAAKVLTTNQDFSASAWAYLSTDQYDTVALSQRGAQSTAFRFGFDTASKRWAVTTTDSDVASPVATVLRSEQAAAVGDWTHLAVTYKAAGGQLRLYANGALVGAKSGVTIFGATGTAYLGRAVNSAGTTYGYWRGALDDVRTYDKALTGGEIAAEHASTPAASVSYWRLDGTGDDSYGRDNDATATGGVTWPAGQNNKAAHFDGTSGSLAGSMSGISTRDSFTVQTWAKLERTDRTQTLVAQNGTRQSGYVLQYNKEAGRYVFRLPTSDADGAPVVQVGAVDPAVVGQWTHLAGVYDASRRQIRLYVNGSLAGLRNGVDPWVASGVVTLGRGQRDGVAADFFQGDLDDVFTWQGVLPDAQIATMAASPAAAPGQLARYRDAKGNRFTASSSAAPRSGAAFELTLGTTAGTGANTTPLYACRDGAWDFSSTSATCGGKTVVGEVGRVFTVQPNNAATMAIYRCRVAGGSYFDSRQSTCDGQTVEGLLGYTYAYAPLTRYLHAVPDGEAQESVNGGPGGYTTVGSASLLSLVSQPNTTAVYTCRDGADVFTSTSATCESKTVVGLIGYLWTAPQPGLSHVQLRRCTDAVAGQFVSAETNCEGRPTSTTLGHALTAIPATTPTFP